MVVKTRGAQSNPQGRFETLTREVFEDHGFGEEDSNEPTSCLKTEYFAESAKSIITRNNSPDICFDQSINPYQGCEHGCIYCYARPSHAYKNLSPGLDFESKIFYKKNAAHLLEQELSKKSYQCKPIVLGANTDPYQPIEAKLKITQSILKVLNAYQHPVIIITKSVLVGRDIALLQEMAEKTLIKVNITLTTLSPSLKRILEPRAASPHARLTAINKLSELTIPVGVMAAPMIPFINDMELEKILTQAKNHGATRAGYVLIRLPHEVKDLFKEWLATHFPQRAQHVMSIIQNTRGGKEYDATFGTRMRGMGEYATLLEQRFALACRKLQMNIGSLPLDTHSFQPPLKEGDQLDLW